MNGRAYDPSAGRFLSVDPFIQSPENSQSFNPYSYVMNNPLSGVDPSGYVSAKITEIKPPPISPQNHFDFMSEREEKEIEKVMQLCKNGCNITEKDGNLIIQASNGNSKQAKDYASGAPGSASTSGNGTPPSRAAMPELLDDFVNGRISFPDGIGNDIARETIGQIQSEAKVYFGLGEPMCSCNGSARVLEGNSNHIGKSGGFGPRHIINLRSAAIITSQFGGKGTVRPYIGGISGTVNGVEIFNNVADVVGGKVPNGYEHLGNVRKALQTIYPGKLIVELPGGKDMGVVDIQVNQPCPLMCPAGTQ